MVQHYWCKFGSEERDMAEATAAIPNDVTYVTEATNVTGEKKTTEQNSETTKGFS